MGRGEHHFTFISIKDSLWSYVSSIWGGSSFHLYGPMHVMWCSARLGFGLLRLWLLGAFFIISFFWVCVCLFFLLVNFFFFFFFFFFFCEHSNSTVMLECTFSISGFNYWLGFFYGFISLLLLFNAYTYTHIHTRSFYIFKFSVLFKVYVEFLVLFVFFRYISGSTFFFIYLFIYFTIYLSFSFTFLFFCCDTFSFFIFINFDKGCISILCFFSWINCKLYIFFVSL